jgi:hypothetical protein
MSVLSIVACENASTGFKRIQTEITQICGSLELPSINMWAAKRFLDILKFVAGLIGVGFGFGWWNR